MTTATTPRAPSPPEEPPTDRPRPGRAWLAKLRLLAPALLALALLTVAGVLTVGWLRPDGTGGVRANARPSKLPPGPDESANVVTGPDGAKMRCPAGKVPEITLQEATFVPPLVGGRSFAKGTYKIAVRGTIGNDTTAAITITGVVMTLGSAEWHPKITMPGALRPAAGDDITMTGTYTSDGPADASLHAALQWQWQAAMLEPCGKRGLIEDD